MALRAFPVIYACDVSALSTFYERLGFTVRSRLPGPDGTTGVVGLARGSCELGITTEQSPELLARVPAGPGPRHEMFVYVEDLDAAVGDAGGAGGRVLRPPADMPWGERVAYLQDPEGDLVTLAQAG